MPLAYLQYDLRYVTRYSHMYCHRLASHICDASCAIKQAPEHCFVLFFRNMGQAGVSQPADARVSMIIENAVQGAVETITDVVVHCLVAAGVLPHSGPINVQQQRG